MGRVVSEAQEIAWSIYKDFVFAMLKDGDDFDIHQFIYSALPGESYTFRDNVLRELMILNDNFINRKLNELPENESWGMW